MGSTNVIHTKEEARKHFEEKTKEYGIVHTFSFDEAWDFMEHKRGLAVKQYRENIMEFEDRCRKLAEQEGAKITFDKELVDKINPLHHSWVEGILYRTIFNPKGTWILTNIWKKRHSFILLKGDMSMTTERGNIRIRAPYQGITEVGTKRIIYAHEDCVFMTIHKTDKKYFDEDEWIAKDFKEIEEIERKNPGGIICRQH